MAAKHPAAKKKAKTVKNSKTSQGKTRHRPRSVYTAAQRKAYQAASRAAIQRIQVMNNTSVYRARRRLALQKILGKLRAKGGQLVVNRARAYAARQSYLQAASYRPANRTLVRQTAHQLFKAQSVATQKNFAFKGETIHAQTYRAGKRKRHVVAAGTRKSRTNRTNPTANPYKAFGAAYGRAAAARLPGPSKSKKRKAAKITPAVNPEWITAGNDRGEENCVAVAIANHLLCHTGIRISDEHVRTFRYDKINRALWMMWRERPWLSFADLLGYRPVPPEEAEPGMIVGFETPQGDHCGLLLPGNKVVSWGEVIPLESDIEEAWEAKWTS